MENINTSEEQNIKIIDNIELNQDGSILDETMTTTKGFRITVATKKRIAKLEKATELSGDELLSQLLDSYDILNFEENETSDEFEELKTILSRVQSIFLNSREKLNSQNAIVSSRLKEMIKNLNSHVEGLSTELRNTKEQYKKELDSINDSHLIDISKLERQIKEKDEIITKQQREIKENTTLKETNINNIKELEEKLSLYIRESSNTSEMLKQKDIMINELNDKVSKIVEELTNERGQCNTLLQEKMELSNEIEKYKMKLENTLELKETQKKLYEETISVYKNNAMENEK